jgi:hypothetical protein
MRREKEAHPHVHPQSRPRFPLPGVATPPSFWVQLPQPNRTRLLWVLSTILERQMTPDAAVTPERGHEPSERIAGDAHGGT